MYKKFRRLKYTQTWSLRIWKYKMYKIFFLILFGFLLMTIKIFEKGKKYDNQNSVNFRFNEQQKTHTQQQKTQQQTKPQLLIQQCKIPNVDPFSAEVQPYITYKWKTKTCEIHQKGVVSNGFLHLNLSNIQRAGIHYIMRGDNDDIYYFSNYHSIVDNGFVLLEKDTQRFCLKEEDRSTFIIVNPEDNLLYTSSDEKSCREKNIFKLVKQKIIHSKTSKCLTTLKRQGKIYVKLSEDLTDCLDEVNRFVVTPNGNIKHLESGHCFMKTSPLLLGKCNKAMLLIPYGGDVKRKALTTKVKLEHDFIRFVYKVNERLFTEHHMLPIKEPTNEKRENASRDKNKLNVMILMVDSMSRASFQRYMTKTYKMLEEDPNSFVMKGHTINGEATTAQVIAMLTGTFEEYLPSALKSQSKTCDDWPFIFKEYEKAGYVTSFSEDYPGMNAFNYRLNGFKKQPTTKYLRPWWMVTDQMFNTASIQCRHKFVLNFMKEFVISFKNEKKFSFTSMNLAHNEPAASVLLDKDMKEFYEYLHRTNTSNDTIIVLFGDHGDRSSGMRSTVQGHLEERLPFFSITVPRWFHKIHPKFVKNLEKNSKVLTTHFDHYVTLRHLLDFPNSTYKHKSGRSLFTDISVLNRTCKASRIHNHWCPCLQYRNLNTSGQFAVNLAEVVVKYINRLLTVSDISKRLCAELSLKNIKRLRQLIKYTKLMEEIGMDSYDLSFYVAPSDGLFEASVQYDKQKDKLTVTHISRSNIYGNQPNCIVKPHPELREIRQYCYCTDFNLS